MNENNRGFPTRYDAIAVDPNTFSVTDRVDFAQWPFMAKMTDWAISAHMGLYGIVNQIILALLGIVLGVVAGVAIQRALVDDGITELAIPWGQMAVFVGLAGVIGVLAALLPARRASRMDVLEAISTE